MRALAITGAALLLLTLGPLPAGAQTASAADKAALPAMANPNGFNRLMKSTVQENAPPISDGIHDPANPGTEALQPPREAFSVLPRGNAGNRIDWVRALRENLIQPRADKANPLAVKQVMDLDIIREVKGSMPDVVYPHKAHTEWLDCAQCHPKIFTPKKGANAISMAAIIMGEYCGVCHGKVAFPVSECSRCHSRPKQTASQNAAVAAPPAVKADRAAAGPISRAQLMEKGRKVYADNCAGCHGENGEGVEGTFPPLKGSKITRGPVGAHIETVLKGRADTAMQPWADHLDDADIAAVVTYERNAWGNHTGDLVQPTAVQAAR